MAQEAAMSKVGASTALGDLTVGQLREVIREELAPAPQDGPRPRGYAAAKPTTNNEIHRGFGKPVRGCRCEPCTVERMRITDWNDR